MTGGGAIAADGGTKHDDGQTEETAEEDDSAAHNKGSHLVKQRHLCESNEKFVVRSRMREKFTY